MKIYLAGPDVFLPDAIEIGRRKVEICARHGLTGLYPLDNVVDLSADDASLTIFKDNEAMMDAADATRLSPPEGLSTFFEGRSSTVTRSLCPQTTKIHPPKSLEISI